MAVKAAAPTAKKQNGDHLPNKKTCFLLALFPLVGQNTLKNTLQKQNGCPYAKRKAQVFQKSKADEPMTVSQWAAKNRYMSSEETSRPGPWRNEIVPYLVDIMDAFNREGVEKNLSF